MELIDKSEVVAKIEILKGKVSDDSSYCNGWQQALRMLEIELNTIEIKEVDLEDAKKEELAQKYIGYTFKRHNIDANSKEGQLIYHAYMHGMNQCLDQLKAQKRE